MKIALDCRYLNRSGIGRVLEGLLDALDFSAHEFVLIGDPKRLKSYPAAEIIEDLTDPYSIKGLCSFPKSLNKRCDALIIPNFLIPFGVKIPICAVMHDLAFLDVKETTRGFFDKFIKKTLLKRCMKRAEKVACVSEFTRSRCEHYYKKLAKKCFVCYNGLSKSLVEFGRNRGAFFEKKDEIVYVGNVKPHKGLNVLLSAFQSAYPRGERKLLIVGEKERFLTGMKLKETDFPNVEFTGKIEDCALFPLIASAKYLVLPSRYEGFGLPPLEALFLGTQPILSDLAVFHEVYEGLPVKFFKTQQELEDLLKSEPDPLPDLKEELCGRFSYAKLLERILKEIRA